MFTVIALHEHGFIIQTASKEAQATAMYEAVRTAPKLRSVTLYAANKIIKEDRYPELTRKYRQFHGDP